MDSLRPLDICGRTAKTLCVKPNKTCRDAASLIAAERLQEASSSIVHYRAALNCLRELPAFHREQLGLNLDADFAHKTNVPTTPDEFRLLSSVLSQEYGPNTGTGIDFWREDDPGVGVLVEALQRVFD